MRERGNSFTFSHIYLIVYFFAFIEIFIELLEIVQSFKVGGKDRIGDKLRGY